MYFSNGTITVTSSRAVIGGKTYAMANITSVTLTKEQLLGAFPFGFLGWPLAFIGVLMGSCVFVPGSSAIGFVGLCLLTAGLSIVFAFPPDTQPPNYTYTVRVGSASGEADALKHNDQEYIEAIVNAMNRAIAERA